MLELSIGTYRFVFWSDRNRHPARLLRNSYERKRPPLAELSLDSIMRHKDLIGSIVT